MYRTVVREGVKNSTFQGTRPLNSDPFPLSPPKGQKKKKDVRGIILRAPCHRGCFFRHAYKTAWNHPPPDRISSLFLLRSIQGLVSANLPQICPSLWTQTITLALMKTPTSTSTMTPSLIPSRTQLSNVAMRCIYNK